MLKKVILLGVWFPLTFVLIIVNLTLLMMTGEKQSVAISPLSDITGQITASAGSGQVLSASIVADDARPLLLQQYLLSHNSPLAEYASLIVTEADKNKLDFRLITAIAMCESNLGKRIPSSDSYNAWGIAVYKGEPGEGARFSGGWPQAISWVSSFVKQRFYDREIYDLKQIGAIWAPPSVENGYSWTNCVEQFKNEIL